MILSRHRGSPPDTKFLFHPFKLPLPKTPGFGKGKESQTFKLQKIVHYCQESIYADQPLSAIKRRLQPSVQTAKKGAKGLAECVACDSEHTVEGQFLFGYPSFPVSPYS